LPNTAGTQLGWHRDVPQFEMVVVCPSPRRAHAFSSIPPVKRGRI